MYKYGKKLNKNVIKEGDLIDIFVDLGYYVQVIARLYIYSILCII